jgi:hypothetical protein
MNHQIWLKILLLINGLGEGGFGIYLLTFPDKMSGALGCPPLDHVSYFLVCRMYGLAAFCLGFLSLSFLVRRMQSDLLPTGLLIFAIFHIGQTVIQFVDNSSWQSGLFHIIIGLVFLFFYLKERSVGQKSR